MSKCENPSVFDNSTVAFIDLNREIEGRDTKTLVFFFMILVISFII